MKKVALIVSIGIILLLTGCQAVSAPTPTPIPLPPLLANHDRTLGKSTAKVTLTEYGDFQCPACKEFAQKIVPVLWANYVDTGKLNFEFRHIAFLGSDSLQAAQASECANEQGHFWEYYEKLYQEQGAENSGVFNPTSLTGWAKEMNLKTDQFSQCLSSGKYVQKISDETNQADKLGVQATPALAINGSLIPWDGNFTTLQSYLNNAINTAEFLFPSK